MSEKLNDLITNLSLIENKHLKKIKILELLNQLDSYNLEEFYKHYLVGYLWYSIPEESLERNHNVENNLKKSINKNPNYLYSKSYLAYFYFDEREYRKVIKVIDLIDFSLFEKNNQIWQSLKLEELLLASKLYISEIVDNTLANDLLELISSYLNLPDEEITVPRELIKAVVDNKLKEGIKNVKKNTYFLANSKSQRDYFKDNILLELLE